MRDNERKSRKLAKSLRTRMTDAELIVWSRLRRKALGGFHFRRQHPIGPYVADFACASLKLVVEIDGATHSTPEEIERDRRRDEFMRAQGWHVLRFQNHDVYDTLPGVLEIILGHVPSVGDADSSLVCGGAKPTDRL